MAGLPSKPSAGSLAVAFLCRATYINTLLGLTFPIALCLRASYARYVQALCRYVFAPFLLYCHLVLLPRLQHSESGLAVWQGLFTWWVTIPMVVFGGAMVMGCRELKPFVIYFFAASCVYSIHKTLIPLMQPTCFGSVMVQILFMFFQDFPYFAWVWCLHHVVKMQDVHKQRPKLVECPIPKPTTKEERALIIGNAPTVMTGRPLGSIIDGFEEVARFNQYTTCKPEYTGTKVTYHFANGRNVPPAHVQAALPLFNASITHAAYLFFPILEHAGSTCEQLLHDKSRAWFVDEETTLKLCKKMGLPFFNIPSSGMVAIECFLSRYDKVYLHGFSFFQGKKLHYFEEPVMQLVTSWLERFITHNPPIEKQWVESLVKEGKVLFLPECVVEVTEEESAAAAAKKSDCKEGDSKSTPNLFRLIEDALPSQFSL